MPTLNWIGKDAVVNHHLQVPFHLLADVPELAAGELGQPGRGRVLGEQSPAQAQLVRLQTPTDWFYPDFVCQLWDGRSLVVEYEGADRYTAADTEEKHSIGAV